MKNLTSGAVLARYGARLVALIIGWLVTVLSVAGASFSSVTEQRSLIALVLLVAIWLGHVAQSLADTGDVPIEPPANQPVPPQPIPVPVTPPAPAPVVPPVPPAPQT